MFIVARMREEYDATGSTDAAVVEGIGRTGRLVTSAALILFLGFVIDATLIRALLVPAVVSLFGCWNWWLPRPLARVLRASPGRA